MPLSLQINLHIDQATFQIIGSLQTSGFGKLPCVGIAVLAYLSGYTHRVAISNHRLIRHDDPGVTFNWKDYRSGARYKPMTLATNEFKQLHHAACYRDRPHRECSSRMRFTIINAVYTDRTDAY